MLFFYPFFYQIHYFGEWATSHSSIVLGSLGVVLGVLLVLAWLSGPRKTTWGTHGSARWATKREIKDAGLFADSGVILGLFRGRVLRAGRGHVLVCGPTGSGKDVGTNFPTTLRWPGSVVILDIKDGGENYHLCAAARPGVVYKFAPTMRQSHCLNVLDFVRLKTPEEYKDVSLIIESHCAPQQRHHLSTDSGQYFVRQAANALRSLTLHVLYTQPKKSMAGVLEYMSNARAVVQSMSNSPVPIVRQDGVRLADMQKRAPKQFEGIWDQAMSSLDIYRDPLVAAHTETSDFSLADLESNGAPATLYLVANAPTEMQYLYPLFRTVLQLYVHYWMERQVDAAYDETLLLLNEFPTLGYMAPIESAISVARSYGLRFCISVQDLGQLFDVYGENTPLWGNCTVKVFHPPTNDKTAARMSRMLGPQTVTTVGESTGSGWGRHTRSTHNTARPLLTEAEVLGLPSDGEIIWAQGCGFPIYATKLRYYADRY